MLFTIYNFKSRDENTHGGVLLLVKLQDTYVFFSKEKGKIILAKKLVFHLNKNSSEYASDCSFFNLQEN